MSTLRTALKGMSALAIVAASPAMAQADVTLTEGEVEELPFELRSAPVQPTETADIPIRALGETEEVIVGEDGVETIVRTRYIAPRTAARSIPADGAAYEQSAPVQYYPAAQPVVFQREQWLDECRRRTDGINDRDKKGGIIGGLLGAITGGIIGNRVADGDRLAGTLIGGGVGGLAGAAIGSLVGGKDRDEGYDCEAALDNYLNQEGGLVAGPAPRLASRTIPAPAYAYPAYAPAPAYYGYPGYGAGCNCYQPQAYQQNVLVPVQYEQRQRVIVRERVTEEMVPVVRERTIPPPLPPRLIKDPAPVAPAPRPVKMIKN